MKKRLTIFFVLLFPLFVFSQNVGIGATMPLMKLHVANMDDAVLLLENIQTLEVGSKTSMYFKTGNGTYPYTGGIKTIGTGPITARLGLFTFASGAPSGLQERMSILDNGEVGVGTTVPLKKLHIQTDGASFLTAAEGDGIVLSTDAVSGTRIFLENLTGNVDEKSMALVNEHVSGAGGTTYFGSLSDDGSTWIKNGIISMNHSSGNVGVGTTSPLEKLHVNGAVKVAGIISGVSDPMSPQDAATKAYVDLLEAEVIALEGVKDIDGNRYKIITIGTQTWMAENLRTTRYNDGTEIIYISSDADWETAKENGDPRYCWYNNAPSSFIRYGGLYNWYAIDPGSNEGKNICPTGWHVPNLDEMEALVISFGGYSNAGLNLKEAGFAHWNTQNTGVNVSEFAALAGGFRDNFGVFNFQYSRGYWWTSQMEQDLPGLVDDEVHIIALQSNTNAIFQQNNVAGYGQSVRCIKN